jgi:hypothetical protein
MAADSVGSFAPTSVYSTGLGITVPSGTDCLLLFVHQITGTPDATADLSGVPFNTALDTSSFAYGNRSCRLLRLDSPASGSGTVSITGSTIRGYCLLALDGVDLTDLFTTLSSLTYTDTTSDTFPVTVSSAADDLTFLFAGVGQSGGSTIGGFTASDGASLVVSMQEDNIGVACVEEAGAASVTLGIDPASTGEMHVGLIYGALRASGGAPTVTDYTMVYRRAQQAAIMGD